ncbi:MAG: transposase [Myxococcales bacterium]|nr:transposase [Myxococcales bacterium]
MRTGTAEQLPLVPQISGHKHMDELREMSKIIDLHPQVAQLVLSDLVAGGINPKRGAKGLCGEQVIRAALIKQTNRYSYEQLAFHLTDSLSYRAFCRLGLSDTPSSSTLQDNVKKIPPETLEEINRMLIGYTEDVGVEDGRRVRTDCTVIDSNIYEPTESSLLYDSVRELARTLKHVQRFVEVPYVNHTRGALSAS